MEFLSCIDLIINYMKDIFTKLDSFRLVGSVSFVDLSVGFIIISFVISVFWKGARG